MTIQVEQTGQPSLVRSLMEQSPTLPFVMRRRKPGGSIEEHPFRVRLMRASDNADILAAAQKFAISKGEKKDLGYSDIYNEAQAVELVQRAILHDTTTRLGDGTEVHLPYFTDGKHVRESLDETEIAQLVNCYEITKAYFGFGSEVTEEAVEELLDKLAGELSGPFFLSQFASQDWPHLIFTLARLALSWRPERDPTSSDSPSTSESDPETSPSGTTGFSELPSARSSGELQSLNLEPPTDRQLSRSEARAIVHKAQKKSASGDETPSEPEDQ